MRHTTDYLVLGSGIAGLTFALGSGMDVDAALSLAARCGAANLTGAGTYAGQLKAAWRD